MQERSPVTLDLFALEAFAHEIAEADLEAPQWRDPWYPEDDEEFVQFHGVADALNFCFTEPGHEKFAVEWNGMMLAGSVGLMASLMRAREEGIDILDADVLESLTLSEVLHIFRSDGGPLPLIGKRLDHLRNVGRVLNQWYEGSFANLLREWNYDAYPIITALAVNFYGSYGGDHYTLPQGGAIVFDKRARLFPLIYEGRARTSNGRLPALKNVEAIGPVVDYQIAKTLWQKGVLRYTSGLGSLILDGTPLEEWSSYELGIRLHTLRAVELLLKRVNEIREAAEKELVTMVELDFALWSAGRAYKEIPHHLCLTTNY